jgi:hypothetical protein
LEGILAHLSDPHEKELVKQELSQRYYQHYLHLLTGPEDQKQPEAPSAPAEVASAAEEVAGKAAEALPPDENLAPIPEVTPISLTPPPPQAAARPEENQGPEKKGLKKYCFIATAAYGSPLAPEVLLLQNFRDRYLAGRALGEPFIHTYYRLSPPLARQISNHKALKLLTRSLLTPIILLIKKSSGK